jgi:hypothetical protein
MSRIVPIANQCLTFKLSMRLLKALLGIGTRFYDFIN